MQEYQSLRAEAISRINLQNAMAERGVSLTVMTVTLLAALFSFLLKDFGSPDKPAAADPVQLDRNVRLFVSAAIPITVVYGVLVQLTLAAWIYQLSMGFRMVRYWNWMTANKIDDLVGSPKAVFLWDRVKNASWTTATDRRVVVYFQVIFLYVLCSLSIVALGVEIVWKAKAHQFLYSGLIGAIGLGALCMSLTVLVIVHLRLHHVTEDLQLSAKAVTSNEKASQ